MSCCHEPSSTTQTLTEMEFERGIWTAAIDNNLSKLEHMLAIQRQDPNAKDSSGYTALHYACRSGHCQAAKLLIQHGADPNSTTHSGTTPLHRACYMGHKDLVQLLIG